MCVASKEDLLEAHRFEYTHQLEFPLPALGRYEFHSVVRLPPAGKLMAYYQGPTMRVVP